MNPGRNSACHPGKKKGRAILVAGTVALLLGAPLLLLLIIGSNGAPVWNAPGPMARIGRYLTHNSVDTRRPSFFPESKPIVIRMSPEKAFLVVEQVMDQMGWEVIEKDPEKFTLHATDRTRLWGFVDDIQIEILREDKDWSLLHFQSKSRVGKGDLGANLGRLLRLKKALREKELMVENNARRGTGSR